MRNPISGTVLITGAAGHLGSHLAPLLVRDGFVVRGLDVRAPAGPLPDGCEFTQGDLCDPSVLESALEGVDLIVHTASIHPWKRYTDDQYLDANVKGTWHLYAAAAARGVGRIVLTSSIAAAGYGRVNLADCPLKEEAQYPLGDLYSCTKHTQETMARLFADLGKVRTFALRPPTFIPLPPLDTCFALTGTFAVVSDIAAGHLAAVRVLSGRRPPGGPVADFECFNIVNRSPHTAADYQDTGADRKLLAKKHWPDAYDWLLARGYKGPMMPASYNISKAERILGWRPQFNFEEAFAELRAKSK